MIDHALVTRGAGLLALSALMLAGCSRPAPVGLEPTRTLAPADTAEATATPEPALVKAPTPEPARRLNRDTVASVEKLYTRSEQIPASIYSVADDRIGIYNGTVFEIFSVDTLESIKQTPVEGSPDANGTWYALSADAHIGGIMSASGKLDLYDLDAGKKSNSLPLTEKPSLAAKSDFALNIDGSEAIIVAEQLLYRIDTKTGERLGASKPLGADVAELRFLSDGSKLGLILRNGGLAVIDTRTFKRVDLDTRFDQLSGVTFSPDGSRVGVMSGTTLSVWDAKDGSQVWATEELEEPAAIAFSPTQDDFIVIYGSSGVAAYDLKKREPGRRYQLSGSGSVRSTEFSVDGKTLFVQGNGLLERFNVATGAREAGIRRFGVSQLEYTAEDRILAWSDTFQNGELSALDGTDGKTINSMQHTTPIGRMIVSKNGTYAASSTLSAELSVWQVATGKRVFGIDNGTPSLIMCMSQDESALVYFMNGTVVQSDISSKSVRKQIRPPVDELFNLATCENDKSYFALQGGKTIEIMALDGRSVATIGLTKPVTEALGIDLSPDGKYLSLIQDSSLFVYDADTGKEKIKFEYKRPVLAVQFAKRSGHVIVSTNNAISVGDIASGKITELDIPDSHVVNFNFPPDAGILVTTARIIDRETPRVGGQTNFTTGEIAFWDIKTGKQLRSIPLDQPITASALSVDGTRLATANTDGSMTVWGIR